MRLDSKQQFLEESAGGKRCYCACEGTEGGPAALYGEITVKDGAVQQGNFDDYPIARIFDAPDTEVFVLTNDNRPTGCGEPGPADRSGYSKRPLCSNRAADSKTADTLDVSVAESTLSA